MSFQIAEHWGNRRTPRPAPRPEVLASVMLHDAGWDGHEDPRLAADGSPLDFTKVPAEEREALWTRAVERAAIRGRYVAYLVSHHISHLAETSSSHSLAGFLATEEERRTRLRNQLTGDSRFEPALRPAADGINRAIVRLTDAIAVHLLLEGDGEVELAGLPQRDGTVTLRLRRIAERTYRLQPWPLAGRRLDVHAEGRALATRVFASQAELTKTWNEAPTIRLTWELLAPGTPRR